MTHKKPVIKRLRWGNISIAVALILLIGISGINVLTTAFTKATTTIEGAEYKVKKDEKVYEPIKFKEGYVKTLDRNARLHIVDKNGQQADINIQGIAFFHDTETANDFVRQVLDGKDFTVVMTNSFTAEIYVDNMSLSSLLIGLGTSVTVTGHGY